ncbi:Stress-induced bacterial acidophilic repeat motif [Raoultella planticola]|uniref:Stress-induced bacterial acidophilic repeat motif n=1 Tax=Raoultella planticola TaxID=575 RepID=A0A485A595_RAOPL|nr:Stress-induced bacterial acidophilic repeat motif [Raoultella planticola]
MANHRGGSGNFAEDRERASEAGRKGGQHSGGNFKNDPQRASEAGKKGGKTVTAIVIADLPADCVLMWLYSPRHLPHPPRRRPPPAVFIACREPPWQRMRLWGDTFFAAP